MAAGLVALSLVQSWGEVFPVPLRRFGTWAIGAALLLYGGAKLAVRALMTLGVIPTPTSMLSAIATWHLVLWDPYFVLGGVLFLLCGVFAKRGQNGTQSEADNDKVAL